MQTFSGISGAWNYTLGSALVYDGPGVIDEINLRAMPVVVVSEYVPLEELGKIDLHHVLGFVLEGGGPGDPSRVFYSNQHRATVMQCTGILGAVRDGQTIVVDGVEGKVYLDPDRETTEKYEELRLKGPPPEPEGVTDQLIKDAMEMSQIDPRSLKSLVDVAKIGPAVQVLLKMYNMEALKPADTKLLSGIMEGSEKKAGVEEKLKTYQEAVKAMPDEERQERLKRTQAGHLGEKPGQGDAGQGAKAEGAGAGAGADGGADAGADKAAAGRGRGRDRGDASNRERRRRRS